MYKILGLETNVCALDEAPSTESPDVIAVVPSAENRVSPLYEICKFGELGEKLKEVVKEGTFPGVKLEDGFEVGAKLVDPVLGDMSEPLPGRLEYLFEAWDVSARFEEVVEGPEAVKVWELDSGSVSNFEICEFPDGLNTGVDNRPENPKVPERVEEIPARPEDMLMGM